MAVEDGSTPVDAPDEDHDAPFESDEDTEVKAPASSMYEGLLQLVTTAFVEKAFSADTAVSSQYKQLQAGRKHFNEDKRAFETAVAESESSGIFTDASFKACADSLCHDWKHAHVSVQWRCVPRVRPPAVRASSLTAPDGLAPFPETSSGVVPRRYLTTKAHDRRCSRTLCAATTSGKAVRWSEHYAQCQTTTA
jgi:hypothetical protein